MKLKIKTHIFFLITLLFTTMVNASPTLSMDNLLKIGRLTFFKSVVGYGYVLPVGFHSELECLPNGSKSLCSLRIYNTINDQETQALDAQGKFIVLGTFDSSVLRNIDETVVGISELDSKKTSFLKSLAVNGESAPYVNTSFFASKDRATEIEKLFKAEGLGQYKLKVELAASNTNFYLAVNQAQKLKDKLMALDDKKIRAWNLDSVVESIVKELLIESVGYSESDRNSILIDRIIGKYFSKVGFAAYRTKSDVVREIKGTREVFNDDTILDIPFQCEINLELKEGAQPETTCGESVH